MLIWKAHKKRVLSLAYSPDGKFLASAGADNEVVLWDRTTGRAVRRFEEESWYREVETVLFLEGGTCLASTDTLNTRVLFWDLDSAEWGQMVVQFEQLTCTAASPDEQFLAAAGVAESGTFEVNLLHLQKGKVKGPLHGHDNFISGVAFSPNGAMLATGSEDKTVRLWDVAKRKCLKVLKPQKTVRQVAFSPDGKFLAAVVGWYSVRLWTMPAGRGGPTLKGHEKAIHALAFSPDSRSLLTGGFDKVVKLWDVASGTEQASFDWKIGQVRALAFAPDGMTAAAGGENGKIVIWDIA